jgi:hypothetical protein
VLLGVRRRSLGHWHARGRLLNEADALPRSRPSCSPPGTPWLSTAPSSALARPSDTPSTFPCAYPDSPVCPSPPQRPTSPARQAAAATRPGRRHRPCWPPPHPERARESVPRDPGTLPRPCPAGPGRRLAGIWPDRRCRPPGTTLQRRKTFQGPNCKRLTPIVKPFGCFL